MLCGPPPPASQALGEQGCGSHENNHACKHESHARGTQHGRSLQVLHRANRDWAGQRSRKSGTCLIVLYREGTIQSIIASHQNGCEACLTGTMCSLTLTWSHNSAILSLPHADLYLLQLHCSTLSLAALAGWHVLPSILLLQLVCHG